MLDTGNLSQIVFDAVAAHMAPGLVQRVDVEPYINSVDQEGLRLTIVVADDEPSANDGDVILDAMLAASDRLAQAGESRVPTFVFATDNELAHSGDPDT